MLEPLNLRPWEIAELTDEQLLIPLAAAARRRREIEGGPGPAFDPEAASIEEQFMQMRSLGKMLGLSEKDIVLQWNELHPDVIRPVPSALKPWEEANPHHQTGPIGLPADFHKPRSLLIPTVGGTP